MHDLTADRFEVARSVADAVLYEGYVLYPYRASSRKNQVRFQWGVLAPRSFSEAEGSERWSMRTECLVDPGRAPSLSVRIRFLQAQHRRSEGMVEGAGREGDFAPVECLDVDGTKHVDWDEAVDRGLLADGGQVAVVLVRRAAVRAGSVGTPGTVRRAGERGNHPRRCDLADGVTTGIRHKDVPTAVRRHTGGVAETRCRSGTGDRWPS